MEPENGSRFEPPNNSLLYQEVINSIFLALVDGRIDPGERLVEADIARELRVSRSPVRQALQEMARQGIVVLVPRVGASVATWTPADIDDFCRLRVPIEALAAEQAAERIQPAELVQIAALISAMQKALSPLDVPALIESDSAFHRLVVRASHNTSLLHIYDFMALRIQMFMIVEKHIYPSPDRHRDVVATHQRIFGALRSGDVPQARRLMEHHIGESAGSLIGRMRERGAMGMPGGRSEALPPIVERILYAPAPAPEERIFAELERPRT